MVTVRSHNSPDGEEPPLVLTSPTRRCVYCHGPIVWMRTYLAGGRNLPFGADLVPRGLDDGNGWVPGRFRINGRLTTVLAPLNLHPADKRRRVPSVLHLHQCAGAQKRAALAGRKTQAVA